jgi:hypothetical protein
MTISFVRMQPLCEFSVPVCLGSAVGKTKGWSNTMDLDGHMHIFNDQTVVYGSHKHKILVL